MVHLTLKAFCGEWDISATTAKLEIPPAHFCTPQGLWSLNTASSIIFDNITLWLLALTFSRLPQAASTPRYTRTAWVIKTNSHKYYLSELEGALDVKKAHQNGPQYRPFFLSKKRFHQMLLLIKDLILWNLTPQSQPPPPLVTIIITTTTISSQPPPSVTIIITTTTICNYHLHNHHHL